MKIFNAENIDLRHLNPLEVVGGTMLLRTQAIPIGMDNIGALTLVFETELCSSDNCLCFDIFVERRDIVGNVVTVSRTFSLGDWIVPLRGELHRFPDEVFKNTFKIEERPTGILYEPGQEPKPTPIPRMSWDEDGAYGEIAVKSFEVPRHMLAQPTGGQVQYVDGSFEPKFKVNHRVYLRETDDYGTVTVVDIEMIGTDELGVEVKLDNGMYRTLSPQQLELQVTGFEPQSPAEGPSGTQVMPRVEGQ